MFAVLVVVIAVIALSCESFGICGAKAEASQTVKPAVEVIPPEVALKTVTFDVPGMTCASCPYTVKKTLKKIDGVSQAESSFETRSATATFDESKTSIDVMLEALKNQGYPSRVVEDTCVKNAENQC